MARSNMIMWLILLSILSLLSHGVLSVSVETRGDASRRLPEHGTTFATMVFSTANSTGTPQPKLVAVQTSSSPLVAIAAIGVSLVGATGTAFLLRRRASLQSSHDTVDNDVEKGECDDAIEADGAGMKKRKRNRLRKKGKSKARISSSRSGQRSSQPGQVKDESTVTQSTSGETVKTLSTVPDRSEIHSTSVTDSNGKVPFTSSESAYAVPKHDTRMLADQPLQDIGLTSTPRNSTMDTASLFPSPPSGVVPSLSYIQQEVILSAYRSKCIESITITRSPSKQAKFDQFLSEVNAFNEKCKLEASKMDEERKKKIEEERQNETERRKRDTMLVRRERRNSPEYIARLVPLQKVHPLEKYRFLSPREFDLKMRHYAHFSIPDIYINNLALLNTLLPRIVEGREYVAEMDGIYPEYWNMVDGMNDGSTPERSMDAEADKAFVEEQPSANLSIDAPLAENELPEPDVVEHQNKNAETPSETDVSCLLPTPALVFSPASPATTATESMPPTPCALSCETTDTIQIIEDTSECETQLKAPGTLGITGLGLRLDTSSSRTSSSKIDYDLFINTSSCTPTSSGNDSFHSVSLNCDRVASGSHTPSPSHKIGSPKKFLRSFVQVGLGLVSVARRSRVRRNSNASGAPDSIATSEASIDIDLESNDSTAPEVRKRKNRLSRFFGRNIQR